MAVKDRRRHHRGDAFDAGRGAAGFIASGDLPTPPERWRLCSSERQRRSRPKAMRHAQPSGEVPNVSTGRPNGSRLRACSHSETGEGRRGALRNRPDRARPPSLAGGLAPAQHDPATPHPARARIAPLRGAVRRFEPTFPSSGASVMRANDSSASASRPCAEAAAKPRGIRAAR